MTKSKKKSQKQKTMIYKTLHTKPKYWAKGTPHKPGKSKQFLLH